MLTIAGERKNDGAIRFCRDFMSADRAKRFVFGRNEWAVAIARRVDVEAFIDDFTSERVFEGRPVIRTEAVPKDGLAVSAVVLGRPLTAARRLSDAGLRHLDYFSFFRYAGLDLPPVTVMGPFPAEFEANEAKFRAIHDRLADAESKRTFEKIVNFRLSADLAHMEGFADRQAGQYFEPFLNLRPRGEAFVDVGGYDGFTTLEFIKRCPEYGAIYVLEPESGNMETIVARLGDRPNVHFIRKGLSDRAGSVRFSAKGSSSSIREDGEVEIQVDTLDHAVRGHVTFVKMDIEGGEGAALAGARETIAARHPRLAVCVYHKADDLWRIPEQILAVRPDYDLFLRHYTEGVTETVMYFVPAAQSRG